jgi:hypothetical protein
VKGVAYILNQSRSISVLALLAILISTVGVRRVATAAVQDDVEFDEYDLFHELLHPLQHEALPQGDFQRIRSTADELVTRGKAIVKLEVPRAPKSQRQKFMDARRKFDRALAAFKANARNGSDSRLKKSFTAVHDSFEQLADLVPTVYSRGDPPAIAVECPSGKTEAGTVITLNALAPVGLRFLWTVDRGKIASGQATPTITVDTAGLSGQTILVKVEADDGNGLWAIASCLVHIAPSK